MPVIIGRFGAEDCSCAPMLTTQHITINGRIFAKRVLMSPHKPAPSRSRYCKLFHDLVAAFLSDITNPPKNHRGRRPRRLIAAKHAECARVMELGFNEIFRMLQIEKSGRLCTAPRASVYSYRIYRQNSMEIMCGFFALRCGALLFQCRAF